MIHDNVVTTGVRGSSGGSPEQGEDAVGVADRVLVYLQQAVLLALRQVLKRDRRLRGLGPGQSQFNLTPLILCVCVCACACVRVCVCGERRPL